MSIKLVSGVVTLAPIQSEDQFLQSGVIRADSFAIRDNVDQVKQIQFDPSALASNTSVTITANASNTGAITLPPFTAVTLAAMQKVTQTSAPAEAATVTLLAASQAYIGIPAAGLTTLTVVLPTAPPDGSKISLVSTQAVTNLVITAGGGDSKVGLPTSFTANTPFSIIYLASATTWYKI